MYVPLYSVGIDPRTRSDRTRGPVSRTSIGSPELILRYTWIGGGGLVIDGGGLVVGGGRSAVGGGRLTVGGGRLTVGGGRLAIGGGRLAVGGGGLIIGGVRVCDQESRLIRGCGMWLVDDAIRCLWGDWGGSVAVFLRVIVCSIGIRR
jgi:hypothetical protein